MIVSRRAKAIGIVTGTLVIAGLLFAAPRVERRDFVALLLVGVFMPGIVVELTADTWRHRSGRVLIVAFMLVGFLTMLLARFDEPRLALWLSLSFAAAAGAVAAAVYWHWQRRNKVR